MNALERVQKDLEELRSEVRLVAREAKADATTLAKAVRRGRVEVTAQAHNEAWQRLAPDVSLVRWKPRAGEGPETPDLSGSLVARLRAGDPVADSLGNLDAVGGLANVLWNPLFEPFGDVAVVSGVPASGAVCYGWDYDHYVTSGGPATFDGFMAYYRGSQDNPFNSALGSVLSYAARAIDATIVIESNQFSPGFGSTAGLPYLAAAARFGRQADTNSTTLTKLNAWVEIWDTTAAAAVAWSPVYDLMAWGVAGTYSYETVKAVAMLPEPVDGWYAHGYKLRICINYAHSGAGTGSDWVIFGDPQLAFSTTNGIPPFMPAVGALVPSSLKTYVTGDTYPRIQASSKYLYFGAGNTAADCFLTRPTAGTLKLWAVGTLDERFQIGDDSTLLDVDIANMLGIQGQSDATLGGFVFGSDKDTNLYRSAANVLKTDDDFIVGGGDLYLYDTNNRIARTTAGRTVFATGNYTNEVSITATSGYRCKLEGRVSTDTQSRWELWGDATWAGLVFGDGTNNLDVNLYRSAANVLKTDDAFVAVGNITTGGVFTISGTQVVRARVTGWGVPTGTAQRTTFATDTVTLINLARAVKAIKDDLTTHGLLGA